MRKLGMIGASALVVLAVLTLLAGAALAQTMDPVMEPGTMDPTMEPGSGPNGPGEMNHMFGDAAGRWYEEYAERMAQHQFMHGYADGRFGGEDQITRGQFAAVMARMMGIDPEGGAPFMDTKGHWAEGQIAAMVHAGIIQGHGDGTFGPYEDITRAQMAAMMDRALEHIGAGLTDAEMQQLRDRIHEHLTDVEGHWAEGHIAHMYHLGITMGDNAGHFRPDEHTNRAQAAAMMWRFFEGELQ